MRACAHCKTRFVPWISSLQRGCSFDCLAKLARKANERNAAEIAKAHRREDRAKRLRLKPLSYFEKRTEEEVNRYVRLRDYRDGCISCDKPASWSGQWHASHWRSVGAARGLRYNLWNVHKACSECNHKKSGNIMEYTPRLIRKIGPEKVEWLESQNQVERRTREYLDRLRMVFMKKSRRLQKRIDQLK